MIDRADLDTYHVAPMCNSALKGRKVVFLLSVCVRIHGRIAISMKLTGWLQMMTQKANNLLHIVRCFNDSGLGQLLKMETLAYRDVDL